MQSVKVTATCVISIPRDHGLQEPRAVILTPDSLLPCRLMDTDKMANNRHIQI